MDCSNIKVLELIKKNKLMKRISFLSLIFFLFCPYIIKADSSKIYRNGYANPINSLSTFLWSKEKKVSADKKDQIQEKSKVIKKSTYSKKKKTKKNFLNGVAYVK